MSDYSRVIPAENMVILSGRMLNYPNSKLFYHINNKQDKIEILITRFTLLLKTTKKTHAKLGEYEVCRVPIECTLGDAYRIKKYGRPNLPIYVKGYLKRDRRHNDRIYVRALNVIILLREDQLDLDDKESFVYEDNQNDEYDPFDNFNDVEVDTDDIQNDNIEDEFKEDK